VATDSYPYARKKQGEVAAHLKEINAASQSLPFLAAKDIDHSGSVGAIYFRGHSPVFLLYRFRSLRQTQYYCKESNGCLDPDPLLSLITSFFRVNRTK